MAIYHLHVKVIGRKSGSSAVASAAYRAGSRLRDERLSRDQDFSEGTFPAQLKISTNGTGWHELDLNRWIEDPVSWRPIRSDADA
jgi:hypothetical protein